MKVCPTCSDAYQDYVDFCFQDGEVLVSADGAASTVAVADPGPVTVPVRLPSSMVATPVPRSPRSQSSSAAPSAEARGPAPAAPSGPSNAPTLTDEEDDEPSAASLERTQPIEIQRSRPKPPRPAPVPAEDPDPDSDSSMIMVGVAAALFGGALLLAAGLLLLGMTTGLIGGPTPEADAAAVALPASLPRDPLPVLPREAAPEPPTEVIEELVPTGGVSPPGVNPPEAVGAAGAGTAFPPQPPPVAPPSAPFVAPAPAATPAPAAVPTAEPATAATPPLEPAAPASEPPPPVVQQVKVSMVLPDLPPPSQVLVDGSAVPCTPPCTTLLSPGTHLFRVVAQDGSAHEVSVEVPAGLNHVVDLSPRP